MGCGCSSIISGEDSASDGDKIEEKKKKKYSSKPTVAEDAPAAERKQTRKSKKAKTAKPQSQQKAHQSHQRKKKSSRQTHRSADTGGSGGGGERGGSRNRSRAKTSAGSKATSAGAAGSKRKDKGGGSSCFGGSSSRQLKLQTNSTSKQATKTVVSNALTTAPTTTTFSSAFSGTVAQKAKTKTVISKNTAYSAGSSTAASSATSSSLASYIFKSTKPNWLDEHKDNKALKAALARRRLGRDQTLQKTTVGGREICQSANAQLMQRKVVEGLRTSTAHADRPDIALLLEPDFVSMHTIVPSIYLTGSFGLQREAFAAAKIWVVINATTELPLLSPSEMGGSLLTFRVPVDDDAAHRIADYFDDVADLLETARRRGLGSVVHCAAGVSRSTTLVLAYLLKYTDMSLHQAFVHTRAIRPVVRPNMGFMSQLIAYELAVQGGGGGGGGGGGRGPSVRMVSLRDSRRGVSVTVPDFYPKEFPDLYEWEVNKAVAAQRAATAAAAAARTATSASSSSPSHLNAARK